MKKIENENVRKILKVLKWAFFVLLGAYAILVGFRVVHLFNVDKTNAQVVKIHSAKLTLDDVMGNNLPSDPGAEADKTVAGYDTNMNGIRDDIELAVFKEYPKSAKTRAVLLQYALSLQMETIQPFVNTVIATEVLREQSRGFLCIGDIFSRENSKKFDEETDALTIFIKDRQFNTKERKDSRNAFVENVRSYSDLDHVCDIDYSKLPD